MYNRYIPVNEGPEAEDWRPLDHAEALPPEPSPSSRSVSSSAKTAGGELLRSQSIDFDTLLIIAIALFLLCDHLDGIWDVLLIVVLLVILGF